MTLLLTLAFDAVTAKTKIDLTSQSIVNRLNPTLRKALLKALTNIEIDTENQQSSTETENIQIVTPTSIPAISSDELLIEENSGTDLRALNLYNSYFSDAVNFTQNSKDDNEIIHTIIVKAPKATVAPSQDIAANDQVIIQFGPPDPVKESDVHIETVQIARSVKTNEIDDADSEESSSNEDIDDVKVTTYKPFFSVNTSALSTTTQEQIITTPAPTHNEDGENIEKVAKNDVKIFQAPLVAAFTVHQDELGLPRNVIPLVDPAESKPVIARPLQEFVIDSSNQFQTTTNPPLLRSSSSVPLVFQLPAIETAPSFTLSKSLELPSTKEASFTSFAFEQRRKELEDQIAQLQQQRQQHEESFRRFEEQNRVRLQQYEQESEYLRNGLTSLNRFAVPLPTAPNNGVQVIPSLSIPTQQLLPVREPKPFNSFASSQPLFVPPQIATHLVPGPQLPIKPAQQFLSNVPVQRFPSFAPNAALNNIDPNTFNEQSRNRHRVFRHESNTANFGNSISTNFPPFYPALNADSQLQNLLFQSGISGGRANEDFNIITKVLSLNHGVIPPGPSTYYPIQQGRFVRSTTD